MPVTKAKGEAANALFDKSIYTIAHIEKLRVFIKSGKSFRHEEKKRWVTGKAWFDEASSKNKRVAVIFADATHCSNLVCWGLIKKVDISGDRTVCIIDRLRPTPKGAKTHQKIVVAKTGKKISKRHIRPYALVQTPEFVR